MEKLQSHLLHIKQREEINQNHSQPIKIKALRGRSLNLAKLWKNLKNLA